MSDLQFLSTLTFTFSQPETLTTHLHLPWQTWRPPSVSGAREFPDFSWIPLLEETLVWWILNVKSEIRFNSRKKVDKLHRYISMLYYIAHIHTIKIHVQNMYIKAWIVGLTKLDQSRNLSIHRLEHVKTMGWCDDLTNRNGTFSIQNETSKQCSKSLLHSTMLVIGCIPKMEAASMQNGSIYNINTLHKRLV